jgi:hypothetical protein
MVSGDNEVQQEEAKGGVLGFPRPPYRYTNLIVTTSKSPIHDPQSLTVLLRIVVQIQPLFMLPGRNQAQSR